MTPTSARALAVARHALPWAVGVAVLFLRERSPELVAPSRCPTLLESISIAAVTLDPALTVGALFSTMHATTIVVAVALFVYLAARSAGSLTAGTAAGLALGAGPLFPSTLAPPWEATVFGACAAGVLLFRPWLRPTAPVAAISTIVSVGLLALAVPALALVRADTFGGPSSWRALVTCVAPVEAASTVTRLLSQLDTLIALSGPFVLALAALGTVVLVHRAERRRARATVLAVASGLFLLAAIDVDPRITAMPSLLAIWLLAAAGLAALLARIGQGSRRRLAAMLLLLLLPTLQMTRRAAEERDDRMQPLGHEHITLDHVRRLLNVVPTRTIFAEEDASVDVLLRASIFGGRRRNKPFTVIQGHDVTLDAAGAAPSLFAFPRGQIELAHRGFVLEGIHTVAGRGEADDRIEGLAAVIGKRQCHAIGMAWSDLGNVGAGGRIALVAAAEGARGPVVLYLGGEEAATPSPDGWPLRVTTGFQAALFEQLEAAPTERLLAVAGGDGVPAEQPVLLAPFVARLILQRTTRAPLTLPVSLGGSFPVAIAKLEHDGVADERLQVCEAPPAEIIGFYRSDSTLSP